MNTANKYIPPIIASIAVAFVPNILRLPIWIVVWCLLFWGYSFFAAIYDWPWPKKIIRQILAIAGFALGMMTFGGALGSDAGVGLLSLMLGLKTLEIRTHRDRMSTIFLTYFLLIANLFYSKTLMMSIYMFISVLITTVVLIHVNHSRGRITRKIGLAARIMIQALPLMIVLFYLFPRIPGSLWGSHKEHVGVTGFSNALTPGSISKLVQSKDIAFRAEFEGKIPEPGRLYWRGLVFWQFDGNTWRPGMEAPRRREPVTGKDAVEYVISLEPHENRWLFALDLPAMSLIYGRILADHTMISGRSVKEKMRYRVKSYTEYNTGDLKEWEHAALRLSIAGNPRSRALARKWVNEADSTAAVVDKALEYFRRNDFYYTLNPPMLDGDSVDDFLFRTRKGYCEHYASAFAFLMRAANIPCRIVGGYLGGEINPYGGYLIVRQSDAHVWVEVWIHENGWVRVDPTSAVAPERVEKGMIAALPPEEISTFLAPPYLKQIILGWDAVNKLYDQHVVSYSAFSQRRFLSKIGIKPGTWKGPATSILFAIGIIGGFSFLFFMMLFKKTETKKDRVQQTYRQFCEKLSRVGFSRRPSQGPMDYAQMISERRKDLEKHVRKIINLYVLLRYDRRGNEESFKQLKKTVRQFNPKKIAETDQGDFRRIKAWNRSR